MESEFLNDFKTISQKDDLFLKMVVESEKNQKYLHAFEEEHEVVVNFLDFEHKNLSYLKMLADQKKIQTLGVTREDLLKLDKYLLDSYPNCDFAVEADYSKPLKAEEVLKLFEFENYLKKSGRRMFFVEDGAAYSILSVLSADDFLSATTDKINSASFNGQKLSPYEKFLAAYYIVTTFRPYKLEEDDMSCYTSRMISSILKPDNEYICCTGYAYFLGALCNRMNIPCVISLEYGGEDFKNEKADLNHTTCQVFIDDKKYHIKGIFHSDPTSDSLDEKVPVGRLNFVNSTDVNIRNRDKSMGVLHNEIERLLDSDKKNYKKLAEALKHCYMGSQYVNFFDRCKAIDDELYTEDDLIRIYDYIFEKISKNLKERENIVENERDFSTDLLISLLELKGFDGLNSAPKSFLKKVKTDKTLSYEFASKLAYTKFLEDLAREKADVSVARYCKKFWKENKNTFVISTDKTKRAYITAFSALMAGKKNKDVVEKWCARVFASTINVELEYQIDRSKQFLKKDNVVAKPVMFERFWAQEGVDKNDYVLTEECLKKHKLFEVRKILAGLERQK